MHVKLMIAIYCFIIPEPYQWDNSTELPSARFTCAAAKQPAEGATQWETRASWSRAGATDRRWDQSLRFSWGLNSFTNGLVFVIILIISFSICKFSILFQHEKPASEPTTTQLTSPPQQSGSRAPGQIIKRKRAPSQVTNTRKKPAIPASKFNISKL